LASQDVIDCLIEAQNAVAAGADDFGGLSDAIDALRKSMKELAKEDADALLEVNLREMIAELGDKSLVLTLSDLVQEFKFKAKIVEELEGLPPKIRLQRLLDTQRNVARMLGDNFKVRPLGTTISQLIDGAGDRVKTIFGTSLKKAEDKLGRKNLFDDMEFMEAALRIMAGGSRVSEELRDAAEIVGRAMANANKQFLELRQGSGDAIRFVEGYFQRSYDIYKMRTDKENAVADLWGSLDHDAMGIESMADVEKIFDDMVSGVMRRSLDSGEIGSTLRERTMIFATPDGEVDFFVKYGRKNARDVMLDTVTRVASESGVMAEYGPQWKKMFSGLIKDTADEAIEQAGKSSGTRKAAQKEITAIEKEAARAKQSLAFNSGRVTDIRDPTVENISNAVLYWNASRLLGQTIKYTMFDMHIGAVRKMTESGDFSLMRGYKKEFTDFKNRLSLLNDESLDGFRELLGFGQMAFEGAIFRDFAIETAISGTSKSQKLADGSRRISNTILKYQGAFAAARAIQENIAVQSLITISKHKHMSFDEFLKAAPTLSNRMREHGLNRSHWEAITRSGTDHNGFIDLGKLVDEDGVSGRFLANYMREQGRFAMSMPDAYVRDWNRAFGLMGVGTPAETAFRHAVQFQSTPFTFIRKSVAQGVREVRMQGVNTPNSRFLMSRGAGGLLAASMAMVQMEKVLNGRPTYDWNSSGLYTDALDKSGMFWYFGAALAQANRQSLALNHVNMADIAIGMLGPTYSTFFQGASLFGTDMTKELRGRGMNENDVNKVAKFVAYTIPGKTMLGVNWMTNMMIDEWFPPSERAMKARSKYYKALGQN
jgi:hypothetical protein